MDIDLAQEALAKLGHRLGLETDTPIMSEDEFEALSGLVGLFDPYEGDDPLEAKKRQPTFATCSNCGHQSPLLFAPADLFKVSRTMLRLCQCPRCFSTNLLLGGKHTEDQPQHSA